MKLKLAIAFGIGYVLGARAGRERYEEMSRAAARVQADPRVQEAAATVETFVRDAAKQATDDDRIAHAAASVKETAHKAAEAVDTVRQKVTGSDGDVADAADAAKDAASDVADSAKAAASDVADSAKDVASDVAGTAKEAASDAADTVKDAADSAKDDHPTVGKHTARGLPDDAPPAPGATWPPHPDEHIEAPEDEVVYSAGPETGDEPVTDDQGSGSERASG